MVDADRHPDFRARVQPVGEARVAEHVDDPAHALLSVVFDVIHVGVDRRQSILLDQRPQRLLPGAVGGDLGGEVGHVLLDVAAGIVTGQQQVAGRRRFEDALGHQPEVIDHHAFFGDVAAVGRGRPRGAATDIGVVAPAGNGRHDLQRAAAGAWRGEDRCDHGYIGQMGAAVEGVVHHEHVPGADAPSVFVQDLLHALAHRAQMHRHVRRVGNQIPARVEQGAGEVQPLLDIDRVGGVLQRRAHLVGDGHELVVEDFEHDRVDGGSHGVLPRQPFDPAQQQIATRQALRPPAHLHHGRARVFGQQRRAVDGLSFSQPRSLEHRHGPRCAAQMHRAVVDLRRAGQRRQVQRRVLPRAAHALDLEHLHHQSGSIGPKAIALLVGIDKGSREHLDAIQRQRQALVRPGRADVDTLVDADLVRRDALRGNGLAHRR